MTYFDPHLMYRYAKYKILFKNICIFLYENQLSPKG